MQARHATAPISASERLDAAIQSGRQISSSFLISNVSSLMALSGCVHFLIVCLLGRQSLCEEVRVISQRCRPITQVPFLPPIRRCSLRFTEKFIQFVDPLSPRGVVVVHTCRVPVGPRHKERVPLVGVLCLVPT